MSCLNFVFQSGARTWGPEWEHWKRNLHGRDLLLELLRAGEPGGRESTLVLGFFLEIDGSLRSAEAFREGLGRRRYEPLSNVRSATISTTIGIPMSWIELPHEDEFRRRFATAHRDALASMIEFGVRRKNLEIDVAKLWHVFDEALARYLALPLPLEPFPKPRGTIAQSPERTATWWNARWTEFEASNPASTPSERNAFARALVRDLNRQLRERELDERDEV